MQHANPSVCDFNRQMQIADFPPDKSRLAGRARPHNINHFRSLTDNIVVRVGPKNDRPFRKSCLQIKTKFFTILRLATPAALEKLTALRPQQNLLGLRTGGSLAQLSLN